MVSLRLTASQASYGSVPHTCVSSVLEERDRGWKSEHRCVLLPGKGVHEDVR